MLKGRQEEVSTNKTDEALKRLEAKVDEMIRERETIRRIPVDKKTHRIRFEDETEDEVTIVIENRKHITSD
ncbi:MAG: hypothetical protein QOH51_7 [Acidobacteriota bacterium]|jgi:hypothetical protein|nr:hypothetical protein [Acidobacteriota bacterium]